MTPVRKAPVLWKGGGLPTPFSSSRVLPRARGQPSSRRCFSQTSARREVRNISELPDRIHPTFHESQQHDFLTLRWPAPPRNVLLTKKDHSAVVTDALLEFSRHIKAAYPHVSVILEPGAADEVHSKVPFPVYTTSGSAQATRGPSDNDDHPLRSGAVNFRDKVDMVATFGGDGTVLRASSFFAKSPRVPPILSFSMGTLGFLGEWKFRDHKRAFREVYMSGAGVGYGSNSLDEPLLKSSAEATTEGGTSSADGFSSTCRASKTNGPGPDMSGWEGSRGMSMGQDRGARILLRNRLNVGIYDSNGQAISLAGNAANQPPSPHAGSGSTFAMNEVILHRGADPHLCVISILIGNRLLTETVADGLIVSTPTGSTAYSLSSGGAIVHPMVPSILLTPVCPQSLSFRPLVLPAHLPVSLRVSGKNRSREVDVSVDGVRMPKGLTTGMEVRIMRERIRHHRREGTQWQGGVPSVMRGSMDEDHWLGGLNGLLKFNYPFGEELGGDDD